MVKTRSLIQTDFGCVPEEWPLVELDELFDFKNGVNADKSAYGTGTPFISVYEVINCPRLVASDVTDSITLTKNLQEAFRVRRGDVLFNRTSETQNEVGLSSVYVSEEPLVFGGFVIRGRPKTKRLEPDFAVYALRSALIRRQMAALGQGAIHFNLSQSDIKRIQLPVPQREEQQRIAEVLGDVDKLRESLQALVVKKVGIKQGVMQELLSGRSRLPGFVAAWESKRVIEFTDCVSGGTPSTLVPSYWNGDIRWMSSGELNLKRVSEVNGRITELGLKSSAATMIPPKCVLIGLAGQGKTRGTVALNTVELSTNQSIAAILPNESFVPEYLYFNLDYRYDELRSMSTGDGGRGGLNLTIIRSIAIPFPARAEQQAIADVLNDLDAEVYALRERVQKLAALKRSLVQHIFGGDTTLV